MTSDEQLALLGVPHPVLHLGSMVAGLVAPHDRGRVWRGFALAALAAFTVGALAGTIHAVTHPDQ